MQGKNQIHINQATMREAISLWLKDNFKNPPVVNEVKKNNNSGHSQAESFIIDVEGPAEIAGPTPAIPGGITIVNKGEY